MSRHHSTNYKPVAFVAVFVVGAVGTAAVVAAAGLESMNVHIA